MRIGQRFKIRRMKSQVRCCGGKAGYRNPALKRTGRALSCPSEIALQPAHTGQKSRHQFFWYSAAELLPDRFLAPIDHRPIGKEIEQQNKRQQIPAVSELAACQGLAEQGPGVLLCKWPAGLEQFHLISLQEDASVVYFAE